MTYVWQVVAETLRGAYRGVLIAWLLCAASHLLVFRERGSVNREASIRTYRKLTPIFFLIIAIMYGLRALILVIL